MRTGMWSELIYLFVIAQVHAIFPVAVISNGSKAHSDD